MSFGKWIYDRRKEARLTQGELARRAGISTSYISTLERQQPHSITNAQPQPAVDVVESIAKALSADIDEARLAAGYAPLGETNTVPEPILEALAYEGKLSPNDEIFIAGIIKMRKEQNLKTDE